MCSKAATEIEVKFPYGNVGLVLVEASKLSLDDEFMQYEPKKIEERKFKKLLEVLISRGIKDFWCMKHNPVFNRDEEGICYKPMGKMPLGKTFEWWSKSAQEFLPAMESSLATRTQFITTHAVLLKKLVEAGVNKAEAWNWVCFKHIELVRYLTSKEAQNNPVLDGIRDVNLFYILVSMHVMLKYEETDGYWGKNGFYSDYVDSYALYSSDLSNAYWISAISELGKDFSLVDLDICSVTNKTIQDTIGWVICNMA